MPRELDILKQKIWENLRSKINPNTRKKYTESEAWAIATARFQASKKQLASPEGIDFEEPSDMLTKVISEMEE